MTSSIYLVHRLSNTIYGSSEYHRHQPYGGQRYDG